MSEQIMKDKIAKWLVTGERGASSEAMAAALLGFEPMDKEWSNHPLDPDDFRRCVLFLEAVPEAREHMDTISAMSEVWAKLVGSWDELEGLFRAGLGPKLYDRMKEIGC